jgi:predicted AAA+ superfamily ATPase
VLVSDGRREMSGFLWVVVKKGRILCGMLQYPRYLLGPLQAALSRGKARLVLGARQTGKSTLFRMVRRPDDILFDLQDRSERSRLARDPEAFRRTLEAVRRRHVRVLIDEVQWVPELFDEIQLLVDRHPGRFTFTLTGSSARRLRRGPTNLLPGRIHRFPLLPICSWEVASFGRRAILPRPRGAPRGRFPARRLESLLLFGI